jgi:hypothetical protein
MTDLKQFDCHTPGPWTEPCGNTGFIYDVTGEKLVADYVPLDADRRLIAAAPTLLAEVKELREKLAEAERHAQKNGEWLEIRTTQLNDLTARADKLAEALDAMIIMSDAGPCPKKFDEALSWRENDIKARRLADDALAAHHKEA